MLSGDFIQPIFLTKVLTNVNILFVPDMHPAILAHILSHFAIHVLALYSQSPEVPSDLIKASASEGKVTIA